jgi:protein-S-isoprenylcysteine O-methyltransferase Ste14
MNINKSYFVHVVLGHSYLVYFASLIVGLLIDTFWGGRLHFPLILPIGILLLLGGPLLVIWAQHTSHELAIKQITTHTETKSHDFDHGPYRFTRSPTHWGLFLMIIGLGLILNSISIVVTTLLAFMLTKLVFLPKEEEILQEKYGAEYAAYKSKVVL